MRVKYLAQEHNAGPRPVLEPGPPDPESSALIIRPPRLPLLVTKCKPSVCYWRILRSLETLHSNNLYAIVFSSSVAYFVRFIGSCLLKDS